MVLNEEQWIKELREKRIAYGISQGRLAVASGITREYLNKIESGKMKPSKELLNTLHKELARFNPEAPLTMLFDYVKIRFPTLDIQHIIKDVKATYTVKVHIDADGDMVIVQNPTLAPAIEKSDYEPKTPEADASVDADTVNDATAFLETFFKLYPTATEKELAYYVSGNVLEPIGRDYLYSELVNPIFTKDGDNVKVKVAVKFIDNQTKATQVSQYELVLQKDSNWKIVE